MILINLLKRITWECRDCGKVFPLERFTEHNRVNHISMANVHTFSRERICKTCGTEINKIKARAIKAKVIAGYGGKCNCPGCDITESAFLCLDHVIPLCRKRNENCFATWRDALRRKFPSEYQLLCYNCNCAKAFNPGGCPHQTRSAEVCLLEESVSTSLVLCS